MTAAKSTDEESPEHALMLRGGHAVVEPWPGARRTSGCEAVMTQRARLTPLRTSRGRYQDTRDVPAPPATSGLDRDNARNRRRSGR